MIEVLEKFKGKKVEVAISFIGGTSAFGQTNLGGTKYYNGILTDICEDFIVINDRVAVNKQYIQFVELK